MKMIRHKTFLMTLALFVAVLCSAMPTWAAELRLPNVLGDNMVIQRGKPITVWGWADAGEEVVVSFAGSKESTVADSNGTWQVVLKAKKANSKPQEMQVNTITITNVLIGDVWHGSGQSNMEMGLGRTETPKEAIAEADYPGIRFFHVTQKKSHALQADTDSAWQVCTPKTVGGVSAVQFYFGRKLHGELDVPIGLIDTSVSGSCIDPYFVGGWIRYNAMIHPLIKVSLKGFLWYQGESNVGNGMGYFRAQKRLIEGWRGAWKDQSLPFYFVQLAPLSGGLYGPGKLPVFWEAQTKSLSIRKTGMVVITDLVPDITDLHPRRKLDIGERLALWALAKDYGKKIIYSGPLYRSMKISDDKIALSFTHTGSGLASRDGKPLNEFQIAGADGEYVDAKATVSGHTVIVQADAIKEPKSVRFGWHKTANPNLMNAEKLPASPFHTDNWQGFTGE
jgi:sialate O-acetylesterase